MLTEGRKKDKAGLYYAAGALMFLLVIKLIVFMDGKVFVWLYDGASQHLAALTYYSEYLKEIVSNLLHGNFTVPSWDLAIGEGSDILTTFHYYCIGDPFDALCVIVPKDMMYLYYEFMVFLRVFLSGFSFIFFVNRYDDGKLRQKATDLSVTLGALIYAFSGWNVMIMGRHPFFLNPMVFLPLILGGVELIISRKRRGVVMLWVFISSLSNLYFLYMMAMITIVYVAVRLIIRYGRQIKEMITTLALIAVEAVTGVLMSGVVFLPVAKVFIGDSRVSNGSNIGFFYPLKYYLSLPESIISGDWSYYRLFGFGAIGLIIVYLIFARSRSVISRVLLAICAVMLVFPVCGALFNGFAYASNRWCFALPLLIGTGVMIVWEDLINLRKIDAAVIAGIVIVFAVIMIIKGNTEGIVLTSIGLVLTAVCLFVKKEKDKSHLAAALIVLSLLSGMVIYTLPFKEQLAFPAWLNLYYFGNEASYIASTDSTRPVRYSGNIITENTSPLAGISSTQFYWSNANPYVGEFRNGIATPEYRLYYYVGYDVSYTLLNLSGCKYYASGERKTEPVPYGFETVDHMDIGYDIMRNKENAGLVYTYDNAVGQKAWDRLDPVDRQKLISEYLVVSDNDKFNDDVQITPTKIDTKLSKDNDGKTTLEFEGKPGSELYVTFDNMKTDLIDEFFFVFVHLPETDETYVLEYYTLSNWFNGRDCFTLNLGWHEESVHKLEITVQNNLPFTCDYMVSCIDISEAQRNISSRFANVPEKIDVAGRGSEISFDVDSRGEYYVLAVPYAEGWTAYIDGNRTELLRANIQYMAVDVPQGSHNIRFEYKNDTGKGMIVSLAGILCAAAYLICGRIITRRKE